ncbi:MAG: outer membrane lipoprotein carrier protein LolA [Acidobacteriota bacterium]
MRFVIGWIGLIVAVCFAPGASADVPAVGGVPAVPPDAVIARLAERYAKFGTFKTRFEQRYESSNFGSEVQGQGTVTVVADGRMVWEYRKPEGRRGAIDGTVWWMLDPRDRQVIVREGPEATDGPLTRLLTGRIRTLDGFAAKDANEAKTSPGNRLIELTPLAPRDDLERLLIETDASAGTLVRVTIVDTLGNRMSFSFDPPERCSIPPAKAFTLTVPKGYDVVKE